MGPTLALLELRSSLLISPSFVARAKRSRSMGQTEPLGSGFGTLITRKKVNHWVVATIQATPGFGTGTSGMTAALEAAKTGNIPGNNLRHHRICI